MPCDMQGPIPRSQSWLGGTLLMLRASFELSIQNNCARVCENAHSCTRVYVLESVIGTYTYVYTYIYVYMYIDM